MLKGLSGPKTERMKKKVIKVFKNYGLKITIKANLHIVDFLGITLDLSSNTYELYRKTGNYLVYINKSSNHTKTILRELTQSRSKRLSYRSSTKEIF